MRATREMRVLCLVSVLTLLVLPAPTSAQQVNAGTEAGLPPNGIFQGSDLDVVNLQNGNLHLTIPILSVQQRGRSFTWRLESDTPTWYMTWILQPTPTNPYAGYYAIIPHLSLPLRLTGPFDMSMGSTRTTQTCPSTNLGYTSITDWTATDSSGTLHRAYT